MINKAEEYNVEFILADKYFPSTQTCSECIMSRRWWKIILMGDKHGNDHNTYAYNCGTIQDRTEKCYFESIDHYGKSTP